MRTTCLPQQILLDVMTLIIFSEEKQFWGSPSGKYLRRFVISYHLYKFSSELSPQITQICVVSLSEDTNFNPQ
jgi:hypothetical protein